MCTLWLHASYSTATAPLHTSIFNSPPQLILHVLKHFNVTYLDFFLVSVFVYLYISDSKGVLFGQSYTHADVSFGLNLDQQKQSKLWIAGWTDVIIKNITAAKTQAEHFRCMLSGCCWTAWAEAAEWNLLMCFITIHINAAPAHVRNMRKFLCWVHPGCKG